MMKQLEIADSVIVLLGLLTLIIYHAIVFLDLIYHVSSLEDKFSRPFIHTLHWISSFRSRQTDSRTVILAVQILRNTIYAAIFIGGVVMEPSGYYAFISRSSVGDSLSQNLAGFVPLVCYLFSFLCFFAVLRFSSHLGYLLGALADRRLSEEQSAMKVNEAHKMLKLLLLNFSFGFRFLFIAIPFLFYSFGKVIFVLFIVAILVFLWYWDHFDSNLSA